jgi:polyphosphate glucokinase
VALGYGVDIGGTGIKAALVELDTGVLASERIRVPTPQPAKPEAVIEIVRMLAADVGWTGKIGVAVPAVVQHGIALSAANIDESWIGFDVATAVEKATGCVATVLNDADAAGLAELRHGAGRGVGGVVLTLTLGTGIGSGLFIDGALVPNTELGHLELDGVDAETRAAASAKDTENLTWEAWAPRLEHYLRHVDKLFWPDLLILGGGASKKAEKWLPHLQVRPPIAIATLRNAAGIVGAAMASVEPATGR